MGLYDSIWNIVMDIINGIQTMRLEELRSQGKQPLRIIHESGGELEFRPDGRVYYNDTEIGESDGLWEVDGTETHLSTADDIDMQGNDILNCDKIAASGIRIT